MDKRPTKLVTMTVNVPVVLTLHVAEGDHGAEVVAVKEALPPEPSDVMESLDAARELDLLDKLFKEAK